MGRVRALPGSIAAGLCALLVATGTDAVAAPAAPPEPVAATAPSAAPDVLILHTDTGAEATSAELHDTLDRLGASVRHVFGRQQAVSVEIPAGRAGARAAERIAALPGVAQVEKSVVRTLAGVPDDPQYPAQRAYLDAVNAPAAWERQRGSSSVRIAVIDTGLDVGHPDLAGKVAGTYNALTGTSAVPDTVGHGTFVAGIAAARTGNGLGVAGAGYDTSILGVKVVDEYGDIEIDNEVAGIRWAADHGAKVINLSISGPDPSTAEQRAVEYAQSKGALVVAAAGNDGTTAKQYPAAYPGVVAVGATDVAHKRRATFTSRGPWVTLAAPGVSIVSTSPRAGSDYFPGVSGYARGDGTSYSAPLVAGAAALLQAQNPSSTAAQLRNALVASAHGFAGQDVGRGQVDFDLALQHLAPTVTPGLPLADGTTGTIRFTASSSTPRVTFRVDSGPLLPSVPVVGGNATTTWSSFGVANGTHTVTAVACSTFGECAPSGPSLLFVIANATPTLTAPAAGDTVSGVFTATADGPGGGVRLLVDGREAAFSATAPYAIPVNASAFTDGTHSVQVQTCAADRTTCAGPTSAATWVLFDSLHPIITSVSRTRVSPNGDRSGDTADVAFTLPERQDVAVETVDARGTVRRRDALGTLDAGRHTATWRGVDSAGRRLPDGSYQLTLVTARTVGGTTRRGLTGRLVAVDTVAPRLGAVRGQNITFFPVRDGYRDTFFPTTGLPDGGRLTLTIATASGRTIRTLTTSLGVTSRVGLRWDGRSSTGAPVRAGAYRWTFAVSDAAGNVRRAPTYRVTASGKRLQKRTSTITLRAVTRDKGGSTRCARPTKSSYARGLHLTNTCSDGSDEVGYGRFAFGLPTAYRYDRLQLSAYGRAARTSEVGASIARTDGGLEVPRTVRVTKSRGRSQTLTSVSAAERVSGRTVHVTIILSSRYAGRNDFDLRSVALKVTRTVLA